MWNFRAETEPAYEIVARVPASTLPTKTPVFYNRDAPPQADTKWPTGNDARRLQLRRYRDLLLYPRHVVVDPAQDQILPVTFKKNRHHMHGGVRHLGDDVFGLRNRDLREHPPVQVDRPVYLADTEFPGIYGHDLVEVLTSAWAWRHRDPDAVFATSTRQRPYLVEMLRAVGIPEESHLFFDAPMSAATVLFPEPTVVARRFVHAAAFEIFDQVKHSLADRTAVTPKRLYISRSRVSERPMVDEQKVEALAQERGFTVIHPQEHSIADQVTLFSQAEMIMGTGGSAMHNMVFAGPDTRVLLVSSESWLTVIDSLLDNGQDRLGYVVGRPVSKDPDLPRRNKEPWTVPIAEVEAAMDAHFGSGRRRFWSLFRSPKTTLRRAGGSPA